MNGTVSTNGTGKGNNKGAVAVVELDAVPEAGRLFADAFFERFERLAKGERFVPAPKPATAPAKVGDALRRSVREKHAAKVADPTRAQRVERARRRRGQEMRHRYERVCEERDAAQKRVRELERQLAGLKPPTAPLASDVPPVE